MGSEATFTRRICAVLLADVTGFSALMGEDDERTAQAIRRLQELVQSVVAESRGTAEPSAGDAFLATFDSVVAAVEAAVAIQLRVATETFAGRRLQIRIGIHFGDVLLQEGVGLHRAMGDAINVGARLQSLAKPGTICVSEGVYRQVRNRFDAEFVDLGRQRLKNISDPVHAYLIVPRQSALEQRAPQRRRWVWAAVTALVLVGVANLVFMIASGRRPGGAPPEATPSTLPRGVPAPEPQAVAVPPQQEAEDEPIALGVMLFRGLGESTEGDWRREALRDGLNTQLSMLPRVKVYSKEFIDFLVKRKGLTEIEAASQLGVKKMLSGSFVEVGGVLRIETHIVDVTSGVMEASYTTSGAAGDFLGLQNQLAIDLIARLDLPVTEEEQKTLLAESNTNVEALQMLLEAEARTSPAKRPKSGPTPPQSSLWRRLPAWSLSSTAFAENGAPNTVIKEVLERLRVATQSRDLAALAALYTEFPEELRAAQQKYFDNVRDLRVNIEDVDVIVLGDEAVASYTRTDDFVDARTGRPMHVSVRLTKTLRNAEGSWKLAAGN